MYIRDVGNLPKAEVLTRKLAGSTAGCGTPKACCADCCQYGCGWHAAPFPTRICNVDSVLAWPKANGACTTSALVGSASLVQQGQLLRMSLPCSSPYMTAKHCCYRQLRQPLCPFRTPSECPVLQQGDAEDDKALLMEVAQLRSRRLLRTLAVVQDISDGLMALNDIQGELGVCDWLAGCACCSCCAPAEQPRGVSGKPA